MSDTCLDLPAMFYRVYRDDRIGEIIASRRIKRMYKGVHENPLWNVFNGWEENAVFLAGSVDDALTLAADAIAERRASNYWRKKASFVRMCCIYAPGQYDVIRHNPRFFAIAISPDWLDTDLLTPRYNPTINRYEWLYPDEITAPVDLEPIAIKQTIAPYDELIIINDHV